MSSNKENLYRFLGDTVVLDAWAIKQDGKNVFDLHADVTFGEDYLGGPEAGAQVRFRLRIKGARLRLRVPEGEPVRILPQSVVRSTPERRISQKSVTRVEAGASGTVEAKAGTKGLGAQFSGGANADFQQEKKMEETESIINIRVWHAGSGNRHDWNMEPCNDASLKYKPWEDDATRRASARVDASRDGASVIFEVRCRAQDLVIDEIEILEDDKKKGRWSPLSRFSRGSKNKETACREYIRQELLRIGLEAGNIEADDKTWLVLADHVVPLEED